MMMMTMMMMMMLREDLDIRPVWLSDNCGTSTVPVAGAAAVANEHQDQDHQDH